MEEPEITEINTEPDNIAPSKWDETLRLPGAITVVMLLSIVLSSLQIFPKVLILPTLIAFSVPIIYTYFLSVAFNKEVSFRSGSLPAFFFSFLIYIASAFPFTAYQFYVHIFFFIFGSFFGLITYLFYFGFYKLWKAGSYRVRFAKVFIPTFIVMLAVGFIISIFAGEFLFSLEASL